MTDDDKPIFPKSTTLPGIVHGVADPDAIVTVHAGWTARALSVRPIDELQPVAAGEDCAPTSLVVLDGVMYVNGKVWEIDKDAVVVDGYKDVGGGVKR